MFCAWSALITCHAETPSACIAEGWRKTRISRSRPPEIWTAPTPSTASRLRRTCSSAMRVSAAMSSTSDESAIDMIGSAAGSHF